MSGSSEIWSLNGMLLVIGQVEIATKYAPTILSWAKKDILPTSHTKTPRETERAINNTWIYS
jgi:hypothetical protein